MNDDQRLLASAALDGAVTSEERARADADPEVVAEIERLRAVRAALRDDVAPDAERRETAIAAALAAFGEAERPTAPPPVSLDARRRSRWMAPLAAAATVAVIAVGAVVATRGGGDDTATQATSLRPATVAEGGGEDQAQDTAEAPTAEDGDASADAPAGTEAPTEETERAAEGTATMAATLETLRTPEDLADFAQRTAESAQPDEQLDDSTTGAADATCDLGTLLGTAYYVVGGTEVLVDVYEIAEPHEAVAVDVESCEVVARTPLP